MRGKLKSPARSVNDCSDSHHHITVAAIGIMLALLVAGMPYRAFAQSSTVLMEWAPYSSMDIVAHGDLDGDGQLDPILQTRSGEGGGGSEQLSYAVVVHDRVVPITGFTVHKGQSFGPVVMPLPGTRRSVIGFSQLTESGDVADAEHPIDGTRHPPSVWQLDGETVRQLRGNAVREVVKAARLRTGPSPGK